MNVIDAFLNTIHLPIGKFIKGAESVRSLIEPLLWNAGPCDAEATLKIYPVYDDENPAPKEEKEEFKDTVKKSKKGPLVLILLILAVLILLAVVLGIIGLAVWGIVALIMALI